MNKITKTIVLIMLVIIVSYIAAGIYEQNIKNSTNNTNSGDSTEKENEYLSNIEVKLSSGENDITLTLIGSGERSSTKYIFDNDKLTQILVEEELFSSGDAEIMYEQLKKDTKLNKTYSSIEKSGDTIYMILKDEYVNSFEGKTKKQLYLEMEASMKK